eukprot:9502572-Pyramimonas_sp.AAC.1
MPKDSTWEALRVTSCRQLLKGTSSLAPRNYSLASSINLLRKLYEILAPPRAGTPLAHHCRRALQ